MIIDGELTIAAPRKKVWAALNDPEILARCIEGCESLKKVNDQEFSGSVTAKIGPVKATFSGMVSIAHIVEDVSYTLSGEGKGGVAGFAKGSADVRLEDAENGQSTRLFYAARANVGGKLAQLGSRLIESTARSQADKFFTNLAAIVAPPVADAAITSENAQIPAENKAGLPAWLWMGLLLLAGVALLYTQLS